MKPLAGKTAYSVLIEQPFCELFFPQG